MSQNRHITIMTLQYPKIIYLGITLKLNDVHLLGGRTEIYYVKFVIGASIMAEMTWIIGRRSQTQPPH